MTSNPLSRAFPVPSTTLLRAFTRQFSAAPSLFAAGKSAAINREKIKAEKLKRKKKRNPFYKQYDLKNIEQFALCDAMRYIRAFEVGYSPDSPKYEAHVKLKTKRDGPILRNSINLPYSVKQDIRIAVICPPDSKQAKAAKAAGAALVGEDEVFELFKSGKIDVDRCFATPASLPKLAQAGLPRILGPRGLMPSIKLGTVVEQVGEAVKDAMGGSTYRERQGVVRMAIGRLGFTPEQLRDNLKAFMQQLKSEAANIPDQNFSKTIHEVVLSSTHGPGFSLNGEFRSPRSVELGPMN